MPELFRTSRGSRRARCHVTRMMGSPGRGSRGRGALGRRMDGERAPRRGSEGDQRGALARRSWESRAVVATSPSASIRRAGDVRAIVAPRPTAARPFLNCTCSRGRAARSDRDIEHGRVVASGNLDTCSAGGDQVRSRESAPRTCGHRALRRPTLEGARRTQTDDRRWCTNPSTSRHGEGYRAFVKGFPRAALPRPRSPRTAAAGTPRAQRLR